MAFDIVNSDQGRDFPYEYRVGTNAEEFVKGEILTLSSGVLTKAGVDTDGTQLFVCQKTVTGATGVANVPVVRLRRDIIFETTSSGTIAASAVGSKYTLSAAATGITDTTTKGCFEVSKTDGATASTVQGRFIVAGI